MTTYSYGDVVLAPFPFTDLLQFKQRPAIIISSSVYHQQKPDVILMAITSKPYIKLDIGEFHIEDWQTAGLIMPSSTKAMITTMLSSKIIKSLARLSSGDLLQLNHSLKTLFSH